MAASRFELFDMEQDLTTIAKQGQGSEDWMTAANAASAAGLAAMVHEARVSLQPGVITRFHAGEVKGNSAPAHLILRASQEFNDAVVAVASQMTRFAGKKVDDKLRDMFGMLIRPIMAGSIQVDLVCRDPSEDLIDGLNDEVPGQTQHEAFSEVPSVTVHALNRVLDALSAVHEADQFSDIETQVSDFPPAAWGKLVKMATRISMGDFIVDFTDRNEPEAQKARRSFSFTPANAAMLKNYVESRELERDIHDYEGIWATVSSVRSIFDLIQEEDGRRISGTIPEDLVTESRQYFEKKVRIKVSESAADEINPRRVLISITGLEQG